MPFRYFYVYDGENCSPIVWSVVGSNKFTTDVSIQTFSIYLLGIVSTAYCWRSNGDMWHIFGGCCRNKLVYCWLVSGDIQQMCVERFRNKLVFCWRAGGDIQQMCVERCRDTLVYCWCVSGHIKHVSAIHK